MTTAVLARTYADARAAALGLGLGNDWVYPHEERLVQGVYFDRLVYVEGWLASSVIGPAVVQAVEVRTSPVAEVTHWPPRARLSTSHTALSAPLVDFDAQEGTGREIGRERRAWRLPAPVAVMLTAAAGLGSLGAVAWLSIQWGWW